MGHLGDRVQMKAATAQQRIWVYWHDEMLTYLWERLVRSVVERAHQANFGLHVWLLGARATEYSLGLHDDAWSQLSAILLPIPRAIRLTLLVCCRVVLDARAFFKDLLCSEDSGI